MRLRASTVILWTATTCGAATGIVAPVAAQAALSVGVTIGVAPPPLPVYVQPAIPAPGYLWTPGYWAWDGGRGDYYWVPGTWMAPPYVGALWTPGYWGWSGGSYAWHGGYWGRTIGFYGGVNYGFGYAGHGYLGGRWDGGVFSYNRAVNNVNATFVHNTYNTTIVETNEHVSYNGGQGGIAARPAPEERIAREDRVGPTATQREHQQAAARDPGQRFGANHGMPAQPAVPRPVAFHDGPHGGPGERAHEGHPQGLHAHAETARPDRGAGHEGRAGGGHESRPGGGEHGRER